MASKKIGLDEIRKMIRKNLEEGQDWTQYQEKMNQQKHNSVPDDGDDEIWDERDWENSNRRRRRRLGPGRAPPAERAMSRTAPTR